MEDNVNPQNDNPENNNPQNNNQQNNNQLNINQPNNNQQNNNPQEEPRGVNPRMSDLFERDDHMMDLLMSVFNLNDKTLRAITFLALNFAMTPVLLATATYSLLQEHFFADGNVAKMKVHPVLLILMCLSVILWIFTYVGFLCSTCYINPRTDNLRQLLRSIRNITLGINAGGENNMAGGDAADQNPEGVLLAIGLPI